MNSNNHPELSGEDLEVWELALASSFSEDARDEIMVIFKDQMSYYFAGPDGYHNYRQDPSNVFGSDPSIQWVPISSPSDEAEVLTSQEASSTWDTRVNKDLPKLFRLAGKSNREDYLTAAISNVWMGFSIIKADHLMEQTREYISPLEGFGLENSKKSLRSFFTGRGITLGIYGLTKMSDVMLDIFLQKSNLGVFADSRKVDRLTTPGDYGATNNCNVIGYDVAQNSIFVQVCLTQKTSMSDSKLISALEGLFGFLFDSVDEYIKGSEPFENYLPRILGVAKEDLEAMLEDSGGLDLFFDDWDLYGGDSSLWFSPDIVQVFITKATDDPSFGVPTERTQTEFTVLETRANFKKTNFAAVDPGAYLSRLSQQSADRPELKRIF